MVDNEINSVSEPLGENTKFDLSQKIIILYLLFKVLSVTYGFNNISLLKSGVIDVILFAFFLVAFVDYTVFLDIFIGFKSSVTVLLTLSFFFVCYTSFFKHQDVNHNLVFFLKLFEYIVQFVALFFIFGNVLYKNPHLFEKFCTYILYFAVISSIFSLVNYETQLLYNKNYYYSTVGFFFHPNTASFLYTFSIPILIYKYITNQTSILKFISLLVLFLVTLLLTFSRAGYVAVFISVLIITYVKSKKLFLVSLILMMVIFVAVASSLVAPKSVSSVSRLQLLLTSYALLSVKNNFLWGIGMESYKGIFFEQKTFFGNYETDVNSPHNFILLLILQFGILTLLSYLFFIFLIIKKTLTRLKRISDSDMKMRIVLSLTIVFSIIVQNFFEEVFVNPNFPIMPVSLIFMGCLYSFILDTKKSKYLSKDK